MRPAVRTRFSLPVLSGKSPGQLDVWWEWETSFFHNSCMCALLTKLATAEQRKGVSSWPLLTAGRGVCLATVVVIPVIQRTGVISTRLAREAGHRPDQY